MALALLFPPSMRSTALVAALIAMAGCATDPTAPEELYEDGSSTDGKADGQTLTPLARIAAYVRTSEPLLTTAEVPALLGHSIAAGTSVVAIRTLTFDGVDARLVVDTHTLATSVVSRESLADARPADPRELEETPYIAALHGHATQAYVGLDAAAFGGDAPDRFVVTVDMCQSSRAWEQGLYEDLIALGEATGAPIPVGVAMTGRWAVAHPRELAQLIAWDTAGSLDITWIDHSYNHPVKDANGDYTFMTDPTVDLRSEVLRLEVLLLSQRVVPSPFFRFPGLTHNATRLRQLNELGLLALDANAWLAKGEPIRDGRMVLLHGNGNEHVGIEMFDDELETWGPRIRAGTAEIVPVTRVVADVR